MRSIASSTADSIPRPSRSIFRKPASPQLSLSHWQIWRPAIAAGCTGTRSISGRVVAGGREGAPGRDGLEGRRAGRLTADGADARAAAAAGRQRVAGAAGAAHLVRTLARELEHLPVEQEEARQAEPRDQRELVVE